MLRFCTLIFQYDIHENALKSQYYYPDLIELQNTPLTYSQRCFHSKIKIEPAVQILIIHSTLSMDLHACLN